MKVCLVLLLLGAVTANPTPPPDSGDSSSSSEADSTGTAMARGVQQQQPQMGQPQPAMMGQQPRPQWLNYPMMNQQQQQQGPYISGWNSGAQAGFATLPATIGNTWRSSQPQTAYGMAPSYGRSGMSYSTSSYQQPMTSYYSNQWSSSANNQNSWRSQLPQANYGSVPMGSSGVQDVTGQQQQQQQWGNNAARAAPAAAMGGNMMWSQPAAQSWSMASYAAPSSWENSWSNGNGMNGNGGGAMWYPAPAAAAERVTAESAAGSDDSPDMKKVVSDVKTIASNKIAAAASNMGWTAGQPAWRKSYTPIGQSGCYSKCRPVMRPLPAPVAPQPPRAPQPPMMGYKPACRMGCNMRPSCGLRAPAPQWSGNTMVCGNRRPGGNAQFLQQPATSWQQSAMNNNVDGMRLYGPRGGYISNVDMGGFSWGGQPQQQNMWGMNTMGRRMSAALTKKSNDEDSDDSDIAET